MSREVAWLKIGGLREINSREKKSDVEDGRMYL